MRLRAAPLLAVAAAVLSAVALAAPATSGAFVGAVGNTTTTAATNPYWSCASAVTADASSTLVAYPFNDAAGSTTAVDSTSSRHGGTYEGEMNKSVARGICYRDTDGLPYVLKGNTSDVVTPSITVGTAFSLEVWFSTSTSTTTTARASKMGALFGSGTTSPASSSACALYMTATGRLVFAVNGGADSIITPASTVYSDPSWWYHVVATYSDSGGLTLYVNGRQVAQGATATRSPAITGAWRIGYAPLSGWPSAPTYERFSGSLRYAAIYSRALTAAQAQQHATAGAVPRTSDNQLPPYQG